MDRHAASQPAQEDGGDGEAARERGRGELTPIESIYLLADSQPLYWRRRRGAAFLEAVRAALPERPAAAYLGASNGDNPAYYEIFRGAMEGVGIRERRMVLASFPPEDRAFLERADLILLAGGDPLRGWRTFVASGIRDVVARRFYQGAVLVGVSAGAVQLGWGFPPEVAGGAGEAADGHWKGGEVDDGGEMGAMQTGGLVDTFKLVPFFVDVHDEADDWRRLRRTVATSGTNVPGLGIPTGAAAVFHPDRSLQPLRRPAIEISPVGAGAPPKFNLLYPTAEPADRAEAT